MLPPESALRLNEWGHDAISVLNRQASMLDPDIFQLAVDEGRIVVTENFGDFSLLLIQRLSSGQPSVPVVLVHRPGLASGRCIFHSIGHPSPRSNGHASPRQMATPFHAQMAT